MAQRTLVWVAAATVAQRLVAAAPAIVPAPEVTAPDLAWEVVFAATFGTVQPGNTEVAQAGCRAGAGGPAFTRLECLNAELHRPPRYNKNSRMFRILHYLIPGLAAAALLAEPLSQSERDFAMSNLHATRKMFLDSIEGLSDAQWNYKPAPDRWSIAEVAEHIALSEDSLRELIDQRIMKSPADLSKRAEVKDKERKLMERLVDRSQKAQAPEFLKPTHRWKDRAELAAHFKQSRDSAIAYLQTTNDELRDHFLPHPAAGLLDAYQWFVLVAAHSERHVKQIQEVKSSPEYPRN